MGVSHTASSMVRWVAPSCEVMCTALGSKEDVSIPSSLYCARSAPRPDPEPPTLGPQRRCGGVDRGWELGWVSALNGDMSMWQRVNERGRGGTGKGAPPGAAEQKSSGCANM